MIALIPVVMLQARPPAPPAPPLRSGSFACTVRDREGTTLALNGELGNWRNDRPGAPVAEIRIAGEGPLSGRLAAALKPGNADLYAYDQVSHTVVQGLLTVGFRHEGWIVLTRTVIGGGEDQYLGFCETNFSPAPRKIAP